jgi:hypothetical protein
VVPTYHGNSKLSFSKTLLQKQQFEKSFISNKRCFGFQKSLLKKQKKTKTSTALFYQKFSKLKALRNKLLSWSKNGFQKNRILKSFAPFKTFGLFQIF